MPMPSCPDEAARDAGFALPARDAGFTLPAGDAGFTLPAGDAGFTLLEVLVAFAIAALALGVLFEGAVGGLRSTRVANRTQEALSRAQSHLAAVGHGTPLGPLSQEGEDGSGYHWSLRIRPLQSAVLGPSRLALYAVQVTESWSDGSSQGDSSRSVVLRTERLGATHGEQP